MNKVFKHLIYVFFMRNLTFDELVLDNGLKIYYKQTKDFRKATIKAKIVAPVTENLSALYVLGSLKTSVNKNYKDMEKFSLELRKNYNSFIDLDISRRKNSHLTFIGLETLVKDYLNRRINPLRKSLKILGDSLSTSGYNEDLINLFSKKGIEGLELQKRDASGYAERKLLEKCYPKSTLSVNEFGNENEFKLVDSKIIETANEIFYNANNISLFIIGDINDFKNYLGPFKELKPNRENKIYGEFDFNPSDKEFIEQTDIEQSNIASVFKVKDIRFANKNHLAWNIISYIYSNMLYDTIREKNSLSYVVYGYLSGELLLANAGFDKKNYKRVRDLIIETGKKINECKFTNEEFEQAKGERILYLKERFEKPDSIISSFDLFKDYNRLNALYSMISDMEKITYDEIKKFCGYIDMDQFVSYTILSKD